MELSDRKLNNIMKVLELDFFFFFGSTGVWTQRSIIGQQVFYHASSLRYLN
jgi:hypothetical protein